MNGSPPETASRATTSAEQQPPSSSTAHHHHQPHLLQQDHSTPHNHHAHCSYEQEVVCDESQMHELQRQPRFHAPHRDHELQHGDHTPHYHLPHDQLPPPAQQRQHQHQHRHHAPRKQSAHSPHHSRHTSPHSHHSHSLHSSPHQSHAHVHACNSVDTRRSSVDSSAYAPQKHVISHTSFNSSHSSSHHHHVHRRRKRQSNQHPNAAHNGNSSGAHGGQHDRGSLASRTNHEPSVCSRRHRSATDVSSTSLNTCNEGLCDDREVQEILVRKNCCASRSELAQYFAEDLYGSVRRPSSCCTSSDYCYHTDSTSLYGSRSSLSRNNSIKSGSLTMRKKLLQHRQPSYTSISLRGLNASQPNSQLGSLTSIFDRAKQIAESNAPCEGSGKVVLSPSKVTIERQSSLKEALDAELPVYACSPSPIRWSFLADEKTSMDSEGAVGGEAAALNGSDSDTKRERSFDREPCRHDHSRDRAAPPAKVQLCYEERPSTELPSSSRRCRDSAFGCDLEESTTVLFHQESEAYNNCCSNYVQCNSYLDQDLQITSEDIHQYLSKGNQQIGDILNNSKSYPFQPSNVFEFQYKNNFANNNNNGASSVGPDDSRRASYDGLVRRNSSKETNLNQNVAYEAGGCTASAYTNTSFSPTDINLSSSTNNINIVFNSYSESNANEVKFINTTREDGVSSEAHHSGYLPFTYPSYDYTNMSENSQFNKTLAIDTILNSADAAVASAATFGADFLDSLDAASENNLLSQRSSCRFSPTTPGSPRSPITTSSISASVETAYYRTYARRDSHLPTGQLPTARHHHDPYRHSHHYFTEGFKFSNAFKRVRKRARKYTDFLRKK